MIMLLCRYVASVNQALYCELSFRYLSAPDQAGRERNVGPQTIRDIPFINQALFTLYNKINLYIYAKVFQLFLRYGIYIGSWRSGQFHTNACALPQPFSWRFTAIPKLFGLANGTWKCALVGKTRLLYISTFYTISLNIPCSVIVCHVSKESIEIKEELNSKKKRNVQATWFSVISNAKKMKHLNTACQ